MLAVFLSIAIPLLNSIPPPDRTTAQAVRTLSVDAAKVGRAVRLTGVVTFSPFRGDYFYLQDATGGVRVEWLADRDLRPGEPVEVVGVTTAGAFLSEVKARRVISTGKPDPARLPKSVKYTLALDDSGYLEGQWVSVEAVVQRVWAHDGWLQFDLARGRGSAVACIPLPLAAKAEEANRLVGAVVTVRGVCKASARDRQVIGPPRILVNDPRDIEDRDPLRTKGAPTPSSARDLRVFRPDPIAARLPVRFEGVVTLNQGGKQLYIADDTGTVLVNSIEYTRLKTGDRVSAVGFPGRPGGDPPRLENAQVQFVETGALPAPQPGTPADAAAGRLEGHVVRLAGKVIGVGRQGDWMTLTVRAREIIFTVVLLESRPADEPAMAVEGSEIEALGVVSRQPLEGITRTSFMLAIRTDGLKVLSVPPPPPDPPPVPWWTGRRVAYLSAGFLGLFLIGGATVTAMRVQVRRAHALARHEAAEKLRLEGRLEQAARLEAVGLVAGGVAHDFNNILTVINGCAQLLDEELTADPIHAATLAADIRRAGRLAAALNSLLLAFSRRRGVDPHPLDMDAVIADAAPVLGRLLPRGTAFRVLAAPGLPPARAETGMFLQILVNLTVNAGEAMPGGGAFTLATSAPRPGWVRVTATDTGTGMAPDVQARVFERGFTTKLAGTGMGLSTVFEAVRAFGGRIRLRSEVGRGTEFEIDLPAAERPALGERKA